MAFGRRCSICAITWDHNIIQCLRCGEETWAIGDVDESEIQSEYVEPTVEGFFAWGYAKIRYLREEQGAGANHKIDCPNCGITVTLGTFEKHVCPKDKILEHHALLFLCEWHADYSYRCCWPQDPTTGRDLGPRTASGMSKWDEFAHWLETPDGQFAQYMAVKGRDAGTS